VSFVVLVLMMLVASFSCKHDKGGDKGKNTPKTEQVTLSFERGDDNITSLTPASITVKKDSVWTPADLLDKVKIGFKTDFDFDKFLVGSKTKGIEITDEKPLQASSNYTIYVMSLATGGSGELALTKVEVGGSAVAVAAQGAPIPAVINAGERVEPEVAVKFTTSPKDATIEFDQDLRGFNQKNKKGSWKLGNAGKNTLKITLKKNGKTKEYTLEIMKVTTGISSLKVGGKNVKKIDASMVADSTNDEKVTVECTSFPQGSTVAFEPALTNNEWSLNVGSNELKITVTNGDDKREYKLTVIRKAQIRSINIKNETGDKNVAKKDGAGIVLEEDGVIEIPVPIWTADIEYGLDIELDTEKDGAEISYESEQEGLVESLQYNKIKFFGQSQEDERVAEFTIKVKKYGEENVYRVKAMMMTYGVAAFGGRHKGADTSHGYTRAILTHDDGVKLTLVGSTVEILVASRLTNWETILVNDQECKLKLDPKHTFRSAGRGYINFTRLGEEKSVKVIVSNSPWDKTNNSPVSPNLATEVFEFTVRHDDTKQADAFISEIAVNGDSITNERQEADAFTNLFSTTPPDLDCGKKAKVMVELSKRVEKITINNEEITGDDKQKEVKDKYRDGTVVYQVESTSEIIVNENGTPTMVTVKVTPKASDATLHRETEMKFNLIYKKPPALYPYSYDINGEDFYDLPETFKEGVVQGQKPLYILDSNTLVMHFMFANNNPTTNMNKPKQVKMQIGSNTEKVVSGTSIKTIEHPNDTYVSYELDISYAVTTEEQEVKLTFEPEDDGALSTGEWIFKVKGTTTKPKISPRLEHIDKNENFPFSFLEEIDDKSKEPELLVQGDSADIEVRISEYEHDVLIDKVTVDGEEPKATELFRYEGYLSNRWLLKKKIKDINDSGKTVTIKFIAKSGLAEDVEWKFKLKKGGIKPSTPSYNIFFTVAGYGYNNVPFPEEFKKGLSEGTEPTLDIYGTDIKFRLASPLKQHLGTAKFKIDDEEEVEQAPQNTGFDAVPIIEYKMRDVDPSKEHKIVVTAIPRGDTYAPLVYKFKVKILNKLPEHSSYGFFVDGELQPSGYKGVVNKDFALLSFQVRDDVVQDVKISEGNTPFTDVNKRVFESSHGGDSHTVYWWFRDVDLPTDPSYKTFSIEVTPKDPTVYAPVKYTYQLTGTSIGDNNASFQKRGGHVRVSVGQYFDPQINSDEHANPGLEDYGVGSVGFTAYTIAKNAKVQAVKVNPLTGAQMSDTPVVLQRSTNNLRYHENLPTARVATYKDKPTKIKLECVGHDGTTKDQVDGVYFVHVNKVPMFWSYRNARGLKYAEQAYDEITIKKGKVKNNKVYLFFAPWHEKYGCHVDTATRASGQGAIEEIGHYSDKQELLKTSLDVKDMEVGQSKEVWLKLVNTGKNVEALTYKVKVTMQD